MRILNAAYQEFAEHGYAQASTNRIVKEASIGKGMLFYYFKSKKDLFIYLFDYATEVIGKIFEEIDFNETDIFKRLKEIGLIKLKIYKKNPRVFDFLKAAATEGALEVKAEIDQMRKQNLEVGFKNIYKNINFSKFREDIDIQRAVEIINWTMIGFGEKEIAKINSFEEVGSDSLKEWDSYSDMLKLCLYK